jgi:hypothetical protein
MFFEKFGIVPIAFKDLWTFKHPKSPEHILKWGFWCSFVFKVA